jgi:hypothetical protein
LNAASRRAPRSYAEVTTMARQQAAQRPIERGPAGQVGGKSTALIQFEPELAVKAIIFHLADEGISPAVAEESVRATLLRLRRASLRPSVEQWMWSEMTNPQRLEWLLQKTNTTSRLISDEVSVLEAAGK